MQYTIFPNPVIGLHLLLYKYSLLSLYMSGCNVPPSLPYALLSTPLLWLLNILQQHPWYITFSFFSPSVRCFFFFWLLALALDNLGVAFDCYPGKTTWSFPFLFLLFRTPFVRPGNVPPSLPYALLSTPLLWLLNILQQHPWYITFSFFSPSVRCFFFFWLLALALDNLGVAFDCYPGKTTWSFPFLFLLFRTPFVRPGLIPFAWVQTRSKVKRDFFLGFFVILCPPNSW